MPYREQDPMIQQTSEALAEAFPFTSDDHAAIKLLAEGARANWDNDVYAGVDKLAMYIEASEGLGLSTTELTDQDVIEYDARQFYLEEDFLPRIISEQESPIELTGEHKFIMWVRDIDLPNSDDR